MSRYNLIFGMTVFYTAWACVLGMIVLSIGVLLDGLGDVLIGNAPSIPVGRLALGTLGAAFFAFLFGAIPALASSLVLAVCVVAFPTLRSRRLPRVALAVALGWVTTACFLLLVFSSRDTSTDWSLLRFVGVLALVGAIAGGVTGSLNPPKGLPRAA
jgi:hypothetical protein